jgi:hypothetical protein
MGDVPAFCRDLVLGEVVLSFRYLGRAPSKYQIRAVNPGQLREGIGDTFVWTSTLTLDECQQVGIDRNGMRCRHAVREALAGLN